jgi:glutathione S-transferase
MSTAPLKLVGAHGSPYSRKMRAVLRYRRIPFLWIRRGSAEDVGIPEVPVALVPVLVFPGTGGSADQAMIDSTPQIKRLEQLYAERRVVHPDPVVAFLDALIEDYADEWLTKAMFHYRWAYPPDVRKASLILPIERDVTADEEELALLAGAFGERQVGRLAVVGSNPTTGPIIEQSYRRLLALLDAHLQMKPFLMGARPGASDFGLFGQLSQLALFDPTSTAVAVDESPRVIAWLHHVEDLGSLDVSEADWTPREELGETLRALLSEVGRVYVPFLLANAAALERGEKQVECEIEGSPWVQRSFPYQAKCLGWLREGRTALAPDDRAAVDGILVGTGCEALFD